MTYHKHGGKHTRLYIIWGDMKQRCVNPNREDYKHYGGKGISVCDQWKNDFAVFRDFALSHGYDDTLTIDRIDSDGNYEPDNAQFIPPNENFGRELSKPVNQLDLDGNLMANYPSAADAHRRLGISHVYDVCKGRNKTAGGYRWEYAS
jgi:hypothetical protein